MEVVVVSDTHLGPGSVGRLPAPLCRALERAGAVVHAGDVVSSDVLAELAGFAPVHAVRGNNDEPALAALPERLEVELGGVRVAVVHDAGPSRGRPGRLRRRFPDAAVVVFGHSHVPLLEEGVGGQLLVNPGSPTTRRSRAPLGFARLRIHRGRVQEAALVPLDHPRGGFPADPAPRYRRPSGDGPGAAGRSDRRRPLR